MTNQYREMLERLVKAYESGVHISSDKTGFWNVLQEAKALLAAPADEPSADVPWMLRKPDTAEIRSVRDHLQTVPTDGLSGVDAEAIEHAIELLERIENTALNRAAKS